MRLVTRSDFDGLICAVILKEEGIIDQYKFVHPKDVQDGRVQIDENDVLTNIPYWPTCGMWFDHHKSEDDVLGLFAADFKGESRPEKSCARIVYEYYGGKTRYPQYEKMIEAVDKSDSGDLTIDDIQNPEGWMLLAFVMDPRTGLGRYKDYRISNYNLMEDLVDYCRVKSIEEILEIHDVKERVNRYLEHQQPYQQMIREHSKLYGRCLVIDLREVDLPYVGNRFVEYSIYPDANVSIRAMWGLTRNIVVFAVGHSILSRTSTTDIGMLMRAYGGGGHVQVGTCQVSTDRSDDVLDKIVEQINKDNKNLPPLTAAHEEKKKEVPAAEKAAVEDSAAEKQSEATPDESGEELQGKVKNG
ncbi:MAG: exopolyphosphatase [Vulcanimicrobiota bacterium]